MGILEQKRSLLKKTTELRCQVGFLFKFQHVPFLLLEFAYGYTALAATCFHAGSLFHSIGLRLLVMLDCAQVRVAVDEHQSMVVLAFYCGDVAMLWCWQFHKGHEKHTHQQS